MQAVPKLVKQRDDLSMRQLRGLRAHGGCEIADELRHRQRRAGGQRLGNDAFVHPGTAAFFGARIRIEEKAGHGAPVLIEQIVEANAGMPDADIAARSDTHAIQTLRQRKQSVQYLWQRKIGAQCFLRYFVAAFLEPLAVEGQIPGVELAARKFLQVQKFLARRRPAAPGQVLQKCQHLLAALGHASGERVVGKIFKSQQLGELVTQRQNFSNDAVVVEASGARAEIRRARDPGFVDVAAQLFVFRVGHDGHVGRLIEFEQPARLTDLACIRRGAIDRVAGQPHKFHAVGDAACISTAGIEHIFGKFRGQLRQALRHLAIAGFLVRPQIDSGQSEITQRIFQQFALRRIERGAFGFQHVRIAGLQCGVLTQLRGILGEQGYAFVICLAHLRRIGDRVQMRDRAEHPAQTVAQFLDRHDQRCKGRIVFRCQLREARAVLRQYLFQRRTSMARLDAPEVRQCAQV